MTRFVRYVNIGEVAMQVRSENSVVLLCRDTAPSAPGLRELTLDLSLWQPLIEDRAFVPWLVRQPSEQVTWPCAQQSWTAGCGCSRADTAPYEHPYQWLATRPPSAAVTCLR